jgi:hypothetical protein
VAVAVDARRNGARPGSPRANGAAAQRAAAPERENVAEVVYTLELDGQYVRSVRFGPRLTETHDADQTARVSRAGGRWVLREMRRLEREFPDSFRVREDVVVRPWSRGNGPEAPGQPGGAGR